MSRLKKLFFIDCTEANNCCDRAQYNDAKPLERIRLIAHLLVCKTCRKYTFRNRKLTRLLKKSKIEPCPEEAKKKWKEELQREYAKNNAS